MASHAGFAAAITVREHVLRTALKAAYANGSDTSKRFVEDLSDSAIGLVPDLFFGEPNLECEGATNLLVATLPMWGTVQVTLNQVASTVAVSGEIELTITPTFKKGPLGTDAESSLQLDLLTTEIVARRWTATATSPGAPADAVSVATGEEFRRRFGEKFFQGFKFGQISLPTIDASFLGALTRLSTTVNARVRSGVLLIGLNYVDDNQNFTGNPEFLADFAGNNDVAAVVHPDAVDVMLDDLRAKMVKGVEDEGASLDSFSVRARDGYFYVSGAASNSDGTVNFSFHVVPGMFHTRPGKIIQYWRKPHHVNSRTWPALEFQITDVHTNVDRSWFVILFGEVFLGILTLGLSILYVESLVSAAAKNFSGQIKAAKQGEPAARVRRTIPPPGGISVRIGIDRFEVTESGVFIGISVAEKPSPGVLFGPTTVPETYRNDELRYILRPPSGVPASDPALRLRWTLEDRTNNVVLQDSDGPAAGRLRFQFSPASATTANDFSISARLYRQIGVNLFELGIQSLNVHMRPALPSNAYIRWRWDGSNPQLKFDTTENEWVFLGEQKVSRYSEWHRMDEPCRAVTASATYRHDHEFADRLPFSLRLIENHRKGLCPYCFFGGPAGINADL